MNLVNASVSELRVLCRRIFFALGYPAGAEIEISECILWLQLHQYPAVKLLHRDLPLLQTSSWAAPSILNDSEQSYELSVEFDFGYFALIEGVDLICARTMLNDKMELHSSIDGIRNAGFILPLLLRRSVNQLEFELKAGNLKIVIAKGSIWSNHKILDWRQLADVSKIEIRSVIASYKAYFNRTSFRFCSFDAKSSDDFHSRIQLPQKYYFDLKKVAAKSFVPTSQHSQSRGAGAEVDDSE